MANTRMTSGALSTYTANITNKRKANPSDVTSRPGGDPEGDHGSESDSAGAQEPGGVDNALSPLKVSPTMNDFVNSVLLLKNTDQPLWTDLDGTNTETTRLLAVQYAPSQKYHYSHTDVHPSYADSHISSNRESQQMPDDYATNVMVAVPWRGIVVWGCPYSCHRLGITQVAFL